MSIELSVADYCQNCAKFNPSVMKLAVGKMKIITKLWVLTLTFVFQKVTRAHFQCDLLLIDFMFLYITPTFSGFTPTFKIKSGQRNLSKKPLKWAFF